MSGTLAPQGLASPLLIRADASASVGIGHVMRCLALAQAWQDAGGRVLFLTRMQSPATVLERLRAEGCAVEHFAAEPGSAEDACATIEGARRQGSAWVVADGCRFGADYQRRIKDAGLKLLLVDDFGHGDRYCADVVLNQNISAGEDMYPSREPGTRLLLGAPYILLRREFLKWQGRREFPEAARRLLITMGGSDPGNLTTRLLPILPQTRFRRFETTVVVGGSNPSVSGIQEAASTSAARIHVVHSPGNMPELMAESDIAVICAGGTLWELLYMGCAVLSYARNAMQSRVIKELDAMGAVCSLGPAETLNGDRFLAALEELAPVNRREQMAHRGQELVDSKGAGRVIQMLCEATPT